MGSNTAGAGHAAAVRRAHQVAAGRIEALREHEAAITATLIGYFEAKARADKIRADAQARTARLIQAADEKAARCTEQAHEAGRLVTEQAEKDAADYDTKVGQAVRRLRDLGETNAAVASMTGLSQAVVRAVEREHLTPQDPAPRKQPTSAASRPRTHSGANSAAAPSPE
jgi:cell division septum initiation protein DivIVA